MRAPSQYFPLQNRSIRRKILIVMSLTIALALILAFVAFLLNHLLIFSNKQRNQLVVLARVLANNSEAPLAFNDKTAAEEVLNALAAEPHIVHASIYGPEGTPFAVYRGTVIHPSLKVSEYREGSIAYKDGHFDVYWPVKMQGDLYGILYMRSDIKELFDILIAYIFAGILIIILCGLVALRIAAWLQRDISEPVINLSSLAKKVSAEKDYSLRANKTSEDEIGTLIESFNEMLSEIQKRDEALTRSNRDLEQFAYVASHDLQEPLRMVSSYTDLLSDACEGKLESEASEYMRFLKEGAMRASTLIHDLLEYSRARTQPKPLEPVKMEVPLKTALENLEIAVKESKAEITYAKLPVVLGDRLKLTLLFQNLIGNAIKFRRPNTVPKIAVGVDTVDGHWLFSVRDNGIGIDPKYGDKIFVIFQRLHHRTSYDGTGIGLAICKTIVETHGGRIWVEPNPEGGSAFYFKLPFIQGPGPEYRPA